ncbi:MAG TPA: hypothetical protein VMH04_04355 [Candidatus Solibacter sp.]|nr:hypothetical protein [Candidatus Solibacter sp.]
MRRTTSDATRSKKSLSPRLDARLLAYSTVATAAGVGLLAMSQSVEAKVVYTAANVTIPVNTPISFDLNNDGVPDFGFYLGQYSGGRRFPLGFFAAGLSIMPSKAANEVWQIESKGGECAAALPAGVAVGPKAAFAPNTAPMWWIRGDYTSPGSEHCPWQDKHRGAYLGLKFVVNGQTHFGWAHVTQGSSGTVLNGYAYETVPNQPIHTGQTNGPVTKTQASLSPAPVSQPATLGLLAQGARGMSIWRRSDEFES